MICLSTLPTKYIHSVSMCEGVQTPAMDSALGAGGGGAGALLWGGGKGGSVLEAAHWPLKGGRSQAWV